MVLMFKCHENRSNRRKKRKGFDRFWRSKSDENRRFLMFESDEILNSGIGVSVLLRVNKWTRPLFRIDKTVKKLRCSFFH